MGAKSSQSTTTNTTYDSFNRTLAISPTLTNAGNTTIAIGGSANSEGNPNSWLFPVFIAIGIGLILFYVTNTNSKS